MRNALGGETRDIAIGKRLQAAAPSTAAVPAAMRPNILCSILPLT
jgi:hypothetical protein